MEIKNYFAQDAQGNIMPSANCYLYLPGTTTLATGLVDGNGAPISNPFLASGMGQITFGAPNGVYDLRVALGSRDWTIKVQCADIVQAMDVMDSILGSHAENPTTRNNGQPLEPGDETWNSTDKQPYWWNDTAWVALNSSAQALEQRIVDSSIPGNGPGMMKISDNLEYPFDSVGFALDGVSEIRAGGNTQGNMPESGVTFFDPLVRSTALTIPAGSPVSIFDNATSYGALLGTGSYTQDANGLTKTSADGTSILLAPQTIIGGDVDIQICMRSLYQAGAENANAPPDANTGIMLRVQDDKNYCVIAINNSNDAASAALSIREAVNGTEFVRATYGNIIIDAANPKMANSFPTLRVILRGNRISVSLNGIRVLQNVYLQTLRWGRNGFKVYKQGAVVKDFTIRQYTPYAAPSVTVHKEGMLYGDGEKYVGWADAKPLNDASCLVVWRESPLNSVAKGHQCGGNVMVARWRGGKFVTTPAVLYAAEGNGMGDYQEQDCILSKVFYNGADHLVLITRKYRNSPADHKVFVSTVNLANQDPADPAKWSSRVQVSFPSILSTMAGHAEVLMAADGVSFITAFYGNRVGATTPGVILAASTDLVNWTVKSIPVDPVGTVNPLPGGDPEPCLVRGTGASLMLYGRARTLVSHDDGLTWSGYDLLGGNSQRGRHFPGAIRTKNGAYLMYRRYTNAVTPADSVVVPLQFNDGISWKAPDFLGGVVIGTQEYGIGLPGGANPGGDGGCLRAAHLGGDQYLLLDYRQRITENSPRLYQYIISAE